jgi:hypothetical protein
VLTSGLVVTLQAEVMEERLSWRLGWKRARWMVKARLPVNHPLQPSRQTSLRGDTAIRTSTAASAWRQSLLFDSQTKPMACPGCSERSKQM